MSGTFTVREAIDAYRALGLKEKGRRPGGGINGACPCCGGEDRFWIGTLPKTGGVAVHCSHGCPFPDLLDALGLGRRRAPWPEPSAVYVYRDAEAKAVTEVCRYPAGTYFPPSRKHPRGELRLEKSFLQREPDGGRWRRAPGATSLIYRLPEVLAAKQDGEQDEEIPKSGPRARSLFAQVAGGRNCSTKFRLS